MEDVVLIATFFTIFSKDMMKMLSEAGEFTAEKVRTVTDLFTKDKFTDYSKLVADDAESILKNKKERLSKAMTILHKFFMPDLHILNKRVKKSYMVYRSASDTSCKAAHEAYLAKCNAVFSEFILNFVEGLQKCFINEAEWVNACHAARIKMSDSKTEAREKREAFLALIESEDVACISMENAYEIWFNKCMAYKDRINNPIQEQVM